MATTKFPVRAWLRSFQREKYLALFEHHGVVSYEQCVGLIDEEDLKRIGITDEIDVRDILLEADSLKCNSEDYAIRMLLHEPLYSACENCDLVKVKWLIDEGASTKWKNKNERQRTCLHITAQKGHTVLLNYLIHLPEAVVDVCDADKNTAAHYSARYGHLDAIKLLYQNSTALFSLENKYHRIPMEEADYYDQASVVDYLNIVGAQSSLVMDETNALPPCNVPIIWNDSISTEDSTRLCSTPTLLNLKRMKGADGKTMHVIKSIAAGDYVTFGMFLLEDDNGEQVELIRKNHIQEGAENVTQVILQKWLSSDATRTYQHLIECLKDAELGSLAEGITNMLL